VAKIDLFIDDKLSLEIFKPGLARNSRVNIAAIAAHRIPKWSRTKWSRQNP
jgi:hypothetical protein